MDPWLGKLVRNGNAVQLTITVEMRQALNWAPNQVVVSEIACDGSLRVRGIKASDYVRPGTRSTATPPPLEDLR